FDVGETPAHLAVAAVHVVGTGGHLPALPVEAPFDALGDRLARGPPSESGLAGEEALVAREGVVRGLAHPVGGPPGPRRDRGQLRAAASHPFHFHEHVHAAPPPVRRPAGRTSRAVPPLQCAPACHGNIPTRAVRSHDDVVTARSSIGAPPERTGRCTGMSDSGTIEGSAPSGETGGEYVTIHRAASGSHEDTASVYEYDEGVYETEEYTDVTTAAPSSTNAFGDTSALEYGGERAGCTAGACPHPVAHPAEAEWEQLVSAVPTEGQLHRFKPRCEGMSYPTEDDFRAAIGAVRPLDPDAFSLSRLRIGWQEEVAAVLAEWPGLIRTRLTGLAEGWAGEDFDLF